MEKLAHETVVARLEEFAHWSQTGDALQRTCNFPDFVHAIRFVNRVAELAEQLQHHPDILIRYNKVTLTLSTHDASGITDRDFALAQAIDAFVPTSG